MNHAAKPFIAAADNNRHALLDALRPRLAGSRRVLEIGSGTGQHAVHFAAHLPHLHWQTSELEGQLDGVRLWVAEAALPNLPPPIALDVRGDWPELAVDALFGANVLHFMPWSAAEALFRGTAACLPAGGRLLIYGPFNAAGRFTSEGNRRLDAWLKTIDPAFGLRDVEAVESLGGAEGFRLREDCAMPVNNRLLDFERGRPVHA